MTLEVTEFRAPITVGPWMASRYTGYGLCSGTRE